jgi:serine/threonine protein kinase
MSTTVSCPTCGGSLAAGDQFCPRCGAANSGAGAFAATQLGMVSPWDEVLVRLRAATAGDFQVIGELGRGGMAAVYLAHDLSLNRKIAIKVMAPGLLLGPGMVERFKQEAVTVANLSHPNIVTIHGVRQAAGLHYFVMKLVPGASLERIVREVRPLPLPVVQALAYQIGCALHYAHRRGVIHRDVKPSNILLDDEGNAVVTDFGIAKVAESTSHTQTGTTVGTPAYMSPEQCWSREVTAASDQYSLGIVIYEMLTGKPPFSGPTLGILRAHTEDTPGPILDARPECPPELAAAVHRMLEKEPSARWPTVQRAVEALGGHLLRDDEPVKAELVRLSQLGPDHPLPVVPTPQSPIPVRRPPTPPPAEEKIEVRMRPAGPAVSPPPVSAHRAPPPSPPPSPPVTAVPAPGRDWAASLRDWAASLRDWSASLPRYWWAGPAALALVLLLWWAWPSPPPPERDTTAGAATVTQVEPPVVRVARVELSGAPDRVLAGDQFLLAATARGPRGEPIPGQDVAWSSSRPAVADVSAEGEVTALAPGRATLTARVQAESASVVVSVRALRAVTVSVRPATLRLQIGGSAQLQVRLLDERGGELDGVVIWNSGDPAIADVSQGGAVTARGAGTTRVVATADGISGGATVVVAAAEPRPEPPRRGQGTAVLRMLVSPWANVTIDGQARGQRVRGEDTLSAGVPHRLRFTRDGYQTVDTTMTLRPAEQRLLRILIKRRTP